MNNFIRSIGIAGTAFSLYALTGNAKAETVVIVAASNSAGVLTNDQVADLFLGRVNTFPSGAPAAPVDQVEGSSVREDFYSRIANKSSAQVKSYWAKLVFTGKGQPPKEAGDNAGVKNYVAANPNALGYVDKSVVDGSVKIILDLH